MPSVRRILARDVALWIDLEAPALVIRGRHVDRDSDGPWCGRIRARVDRDVHALHVLLLDAENLRRATYPADDRICIECAEVDQPLVVALTACRRIILPSASVAIAE